MKKKIIDIKKNQFFIYSCTTLIAPLFFFKANDYEEYSQGIYSLQLIYSNLQNFFSNFNLNLGMGTTFPIGQGLFLYPTSFFAFNLQLFIILTIILNSLIQYNYFQKICKKILKIDNPFLLKVFTSLVIISLPNLVYNYFTDWISHYTACTFFLPITYYLLKYDKYHKPGSLIKLALCFVLFFHNSHLGYSLHITIMFLSFIFLNKTKIFFYKKTVIILSCLIFLICLGKIYEIISFYNSYSVDVKNVGNFTPIKSIDILKSILLPFNYFLRLLDYIFQTNLSFEKFTGLLKSNVIGYGIQTVFAFLISIFFIIKKISKKIFYLDYVFLILVTIFILNNFYNITNYLTYTKDMIGIFSFLLIIYFLNRLRNKKVLNITLVILFFTNVMLYIESFNHLKNNNLSNINTSYPNNNSFIKKLRLLDLDNSEFSRIYLSEKVYEEINSRKNNYFKKNNIFSPKDFNNFKINILNTMTKNVHNVGLRDEYIRMYNNIYPKNAEIQNNLLMDFFKIKFIIIYESEFKNNKNLSLKIIEKFNIDNNKLLIIENINFGNDLIIINNNYNDNCVGFNKLNCLLNFKNNLEINNKITIRNTNKNKIFIVNENFKEIKLILPFTINNIWSFTNSNKKLFNHFDIVELGPSKSLEINLISYNYVFFKVITILSLIFLIYLSLKTKNFLT